VYQFGNEGLENRGTQRKRNSVLRFLRLMQART
jgi:hypothetical protein